MGWRRHCVDKSPTPSLARPLSFCLDDLWCPSTENKLMTLIITLLPSDFPRNIQVRKCTLLLYIQRNYLWIYRNMFAVQSQWFVTSHTALYCTALYCTVMYCIALYCIVLYSYVYTANTIQTHHLAVSPLGTKLTCLLRHLIYYSNIHNSTYANYKTQSDPFNPASHPTF